MNRVIFREFFADRSMFSRLASEHFARGLSVNHHKIQKTFKIIITNRYDDLDNFTCKISTSRSNL